REYQDVGLDGLSDEDEVLFFDSVYVQEIANNPALGTLSIAYQNALKDPSGDNFQYFRGTDFDNNETPLLKRYKSFNNVDGNSSTTEQAIESYSTSASSTPNSEDINRDNTLGESESYFQYKVRLSPQTMNISNPYISDVLETTVDTKNGDERVIKWYQFRVPVYNPEKVIGSIQDFKSIRFMRMVLSDFSEPIVCRFATLELVRGEWRRYNLDLTEGGEYIPNDIDDETLFDVSAVNIEENGQRDPINYVLPPGIEQNIDNTTTTIRRDNEQSLVLKICNLKDGDSRAAYKTSDLDVRAYKRLKMFVHAEGKDDDLLDGELSCFIRLGTDFTSNYYEYEIPLQSTNHGDNGREEVWPLVNNIDIRFEDFQLAKQERNFTLDDVNSPYIMFLGGGKKITVVGNPNLSRVKTIMIGVRNPKKTSLDSEDDGLPKCGEIWVNELRLTDFDEYGGWAANARFTSRLADFGTVTVAGNMSTIGFGSIEKKINERQKSDDYQYDLSSNLELGKFFPEKYGFKIPLHVSSSEQFSNPQYNPLDPDILFKTTLETMGSKYEQDSLKHIAQDYVSRNAVNFTNIRKLPTQNKGDNGKTKTPKVYDLENFTLSYSKNELFLRNINTEKNRTKNYRGALTYNFNTRPKNIKPFSKLKIGKGPYARLIKDINFYTMPKSFSYRSDMDRMYNETKLRNVNNSYMIIEPTYNKYFNWNKSYEFKYDLTRTFKIDFSARSQASVDEPEGRMDNDYVYFKQNRDTVWQNFWDGGRPTMYHHDISVNYQLPLNKIPLTNFLSLNTRYNANYDWTAAPLALSELGNNIQNSNNIQYNGQINLSTLYNKVPYFKKVLNSGKRKQRGRGRTSRNNDENKKEEEEEKKDRYKAFRYATKFVLGVKNISVNLTQNKGTFIPGFLPEAHFFGQHWGEVAPGIPFVLGSQRDIRFLAGQNGWLTQNENMNTLFKKNASTNLVLRSTVEPFHKFRIEFTVNKMQSLNEQEFYRWSDDDNMFAHFSETQNGTFSMSFISFGTAFVVNNKEDESKVFQQFRNYRNEIAKRLAVQNPNYNGIIDSTGFPTGYGSTSQDVLIPAFLAAYSGQDALGVSLNTMPKIPLPNWRINYDGLMQIKFIKKRFQTFTIGHAYRSTYSVGSFVSSLDYDDNSSGWS
ncbi:cell surface protein SprA, partial [Flavobacteriales bacterium]|nr:cell surface protein SprA [Flavobacteriales bacterium]